MAYHCIRGYWLVWYLEELRSGLLKDIFTARHGSKWIDSRIATELGMEATGFWNKIDDAIVDHFEKLEAVTYKGIH